MNNTSANLNNFNQAWPLLFADYEEMNELNLSRHFKHLYFKVCQIPFADGQNDHQKTVVKFIQEYDNHPANEFGETPLHTAAQNGDMLSVLLILQHSQYKNPEAKNGMTPLHSAASRGDLEITQLLLQHCQDKNPENKAGETPLHWAARNGHMKVTRLLLQHSQDKNLEDKVGQTPLHNAALNGDLEVTRLLLQHCQDKNLEDKYGWTPLHWAAIRGHLETTDCFCSIAKTRIQKTRMARLHFTMLKTLVMLTLSN
jgi:ankyrin repeat protein